MTKITVSNDPTVYLRNSGLVPSTHNILHASFTEGKNKEHSRPLPSILMYKQKVKK